MTADVVSPLPRDHKPFTALIGARVRGQLAERGLRQADLAEAFGQSQQTVSKKLAGTVPLDLNELAIIAGFLGMSVGRLLGELGDYVPPPRGSVGSDGNTRRNVALIRPRWSSFAPPFALVDDSNKAA